MILVLENGKQLRGDMIKSAVLRNDLTPIPETLEAEIRYDEGLSRYIKEGAIIEALPGNLHKIVKVELQAERAMQGSRPLAAWRITTMLAATEPLSKPRRAAVIQSSGNLSAIYRACGCKLPAVEGDFPSKSFCCPVGQVPTFHIAKLLQEEGGIVRWRRNKIGFFRLLDLARQDSKVVIPTNAATEVSSGLSILHDVPVYYSLDDHGKPIYGNSDKERKAVFVPNRNIQQLTNMSRVLIRTHDARVEYSAGGHYAGDVVKMADKENRVIITAAHVYQTGTDGSGTTQYTRLWLGKVAG